MSVPPNYQPPPGGGYYAPPPQPPASNSSGCWKAAGITCGVLFLLSIIGGVALVMVAMKNPMVKQIAAVAGDTAKGVQIQQAIVRYHADKHSYPTTLSELVPAYLPDRTILHSDLDPVSKDPQHISWKYFHPNEKTPGGAPLIRLDFNMTMPSSSTPGKEETSSEHITINLDGTTSSTEPGASTAPTFNASPGSLRQGGGGLGTR